MQSGSFAASVVGPTGTLSLFEENVDRNATTGFIYPFTVKTGEAVAFRETSDAQFATAYSLGQTITGTPILQSGVTTPVSVKWANPAGTGTGSNNTTTYLLTGGTNDGLFHQFPMDVEYFQVVTGMTYSNFMSQAGSSLQNSLVTRAFTNTFYVNRIKRYKGSCNCVDDSVFTPTSIFENNGSQYVINYK